MDEQVLRQRVEREDLVMFVNACFACTRQNEFYSNRMGQSLSIGFLHEYIMGNYRRLYARTLAAGINHFNQSLIIQNLLAAGSPSDVELRAEEGALIRMAVKSLPVNRVFKLFAMLRQRRVNNRRTRAVIRDFLLQRKCEVPKEVSNRRSPCSSVTGQGNGRLSIQIRESATI